MHIMPIKKFVPGIFVILATAVFSLVQEDQFVSYSVNGKNLHFTNVKLQSSEEGGFVHLEAGNTEKVDFGENAYPRYRDLEVGITIEVSTGGSMIGTHTAHASDIMPVYLSWYNTVKSRDRKEIRQVLASMDSGAEDLLEFSITFANFGPKGTLIKGTFNGKLLDEEGILYDVTDGKFAIEVTDLE